MATGLGLAALCAGGFAWLRARRAEALPVYYAVPAFTLTDQDGRTRGLADLAGQPWIGDFIFTRCAGICPAMTARLARLQPKVPAGVRFVSITVDPEHDTAEVLKRYAHDYEAGPSWLFLTGPRSDLYRLAVDGFKLEAMAVPPDQQQGGDGPFLHSSKLVLVDAQGRIRGYYDSADEAAVSRLIVAIAQLADESR
jgi:protein SCO1/2